MSGEVSIRFALRIVLDRFLEQRGFTLVTLEQAESDPAYQSDPNLPLKWGGTLLEQMTVASTYKHPRIERSHLRSSSLSVAERGNALGQQIGRAHV